MKLRKRFDGISGKLREGEVGMIKIYCINVRNCQRIKKELKDLILLDTSAI